MTVIDLAKERKKRMTQAPLLDVGPAVPSPPKPLPGGKRLHVLGYCKTAEVAHANAELVLETIQCVKRKTDGTTWGWIDGLCPICRSMGGTLLFNRCVQERIEVEQRRESPAKRSKRLERQRLWFESVMDKSKKTAERAEKVLLTAKRTMDKAARMLGADVELP